MWLDIVRVANKREILRRDWLKEDPVLSKMLIFRFASGTNFPVTQNEERRLIALWDATGKDWTRDEAVAALWAYDKTYGGPVSKLSGSPVAQVATQIGRAISGTYNKLMNFRALDPRDDRKGFDSNAEIDNLVWAEFFDPTSSRLDSSALEKEYLRLWSSGWTPPTDAQRHDETLVAEVESLRKQGLEALLARYAGKKAKGKPRAGRSNTTVYERDALIVAIAIERANSKCEIPNCSYVPFQTRKRELYVEVHHIVPLARGGYDVPENVACVCPSHHRELHLGVKAKDLQKLLQNLRTA